MEESFWWVGTKVVVEHLEECLSPWLLSEYKYVVKLFGKSTVFTNVRDPVTRNILRGLNVEVTEKSIVELVTEGVIGRVIVLDPRARDGLKPEDLREVDVVVIGGIMGEHPPKGRTYASITSKLRLKCLVRNLGKLQLTIAGTAYVLSKIAGGVLLEELDIKFGLRLSVNIGNYEVSIELPYAFPYENGVPVLPEDYMEVVSRRSTVFEARSGCLEQSNNTPSTTSLR